MARPRSTARTRRRRRPGPLDGITLLSTRPGPFDPGRKEYEEDPTTGMGGGAGNGVPRQSGGTSGDLSIPGWRNETPIAPPYSPSSPAPSGPAPRGPSPFAEPPTLVSLRAPTSPLLTPSRSRALGKGLAELLQPSSALEAILGGLRGEDGAPDQPEAPPEPPPLTQERIATATQKAWNRYQAHVDEVGGFGSPGSKQLLDRIYGRASKNIGLDLSNFLTTGDPANPQGRQELRRAGVAGGSPAGMVQAPASRPVDPATAVFSSNPGQPAYQPGGAGDPADPLGAKTLGNVTAAELAQAGQAGDLRISPRGVISTTPGRRAVLELRDAQKRVAASGASLQQLHRQFPELSVSMLQGLRAAERRTGAPPALLAAISGVESDYGRSDLDGVRSGQNPWGAAGPFQIGNGTGAAGAAWGTVSRELWGDRAGQHSIYDDRDAAIGAGQYLTETFADATKDPSTWYDAAFSYNHADWYAQKVVALAKSKLPLEKLGAPPDPAAQASLEEAKANAREVGINPELVLGKQHAGLPPIEPQVMSRFQAGLKAAKQLDSLGLPYSWAGGHNVEFRPGGDEENGGPGYDCSGAVSYVLKAMGVLDSPLTSGDMGSVLQPGPGAITVYYNGTHTFMKIGKRYFGTSSSNDAGGAGFYPTSVGDSQVAGYSVGHVPGLGKKVALQLGIKPGELDFGGGGSSSDGMVYSADGTEATIAPGAGASVEGGARYSNAPIELTQLASPLSAGPVLPTAYLGAGGAEDEGEPEPSPAESILALLGEATDPGASLGVRRRPIL